MTQEMPSEEWLQQRDWEEWERICSLSKEQLDAELRALGFDPDALRERLDKKVREAFAKKGIILT